MTNGSTLTDTSHIHIIAGLLVDDTPDINSDLMNFLLIFSTEVFLWE